MGEKQGWGHIKKGVTVRFGFDVLEPGKFKRFVKNKATGTPYGVYGHCILNNFYSSVLWKFVGCICRIYHRGAFGVARFDKSGNSRALGRGASSRLAPRLFFLSSIKKSIIP